MTTLQKNLFDQVLDFANRANPYPIYARMREHPVFAQEDGRYIISTFDTIRSALTDPRFSSDLRKSYSLEDQRIVPEGGELSFLSLDPPKHDWMRHQVMSKFTPDLIYSLHTRIEEVINSILDACSSEKQLDIVDDLAYPLPVIVICELLGVPREDEPLFHKWADQIIKGIDPGSAVKGDLAREAQAGRDQLFHYMGDLIDRLQKQPGNNLLSAILHDATHEKRMSRQELVSTAGLLLNAGHLTTVNLLTNSMLAMLRYPDTFESLRHNPDLVSNLVEEVLRYDPPVQLVRRTTLVDIPFAGVSIPKGAPVYLITASGNHDPLRFNEPDRFDPWRKDIEHLGFGGGIHYCVGAPLARLEAQIALKALSRRIQSPHLMADPPTYRESATLRGPRHLPISYERILP